MVAGVCTFGRVRYVGIQWLAVLIVRVTAVVHAQRTQAQIMISRTYARCGIRCVLSFIFIRIVRVVIVRIFIVLFTLSLDFLHFGSLILKPYLHNSHT